MATEKPEKPQTAISADLFERAKALLDELYQTREDCPLAVAKMAIKLGIALRQIELASVHVAHDRDKISWARVENALNLPARYAWEHYQKNPNPKKVRRMSQTMINRLAEPVFMSIVSGEKMKPEVEEKPED